MAAALARGAQAAVPQGANGVGDLARNAAADQSSGTWELWRACNGGSAAACGHQLEAINQADLSACLLYTSDAADEN